MNSITILAFIFGFFSSIAFAEDVVFPISSIRVLTENVDRYYDKTNSAIATIICKEEASQAMIVDARVPALDGKIFYFPNLAVCNESRTKARQVISRCSPELIVNTQTLLAKISIDKCQ